MGDESVRGSSNHLLDGAQAEGNREDGVADVLHKAPRRAVHPAECAHARRQARAVAGGMCAWDVSLEPPTTAPTACLGQKAVADVHRDGWQLNHLMGMGTCGGGQSAMAAGTGCWIDVVHGGAHVRSHPHRDGPCVLPVSPRRCAGRGW